MTIFLSNISHLKTPNIDHNHRSQWTSSRWDLNRALDYDCTLSFCSKSEHKRNWFAFSSMLIASLAKFNLTKYFFQIFYRFRFIEAMVANFHCLLLKRVGGKNWFWAEIWSMASRSNFFDSLGELIFLIMTVLVLWCCNFITL